MRWTWPAFALTLGLAGVQVPAFGVPDAPLRVFIHEAGFPPLTFGSSAPRTGIYPELMDQICRRMGRSWVAVCLPPGQIYAQFGRLYDVEVGVVPAWRSSQSALSVYSVPFAQDENIVFRLPDSPPTPGILGTVLGYVYPSLEPSFADGSLTRVDTRNEGVLMNLLAGGRVGQVVMTKIVAHYYARERHLKLDVLRTIDPNLLRIRLSASLKRLLPELNAALTTLVADGTVERIYAR